MRRTAITGAAALAAALALVLSGCGSDTKTEPSTTESETTTTTTTTSAKAAPTTTAKVAPRDEDAAGPNPTIASYIVENNIQETPVKRGDPGSPTIDLPIPDGWEPAGENTPEWAYGAIIYTGPEAAEYSPSIVALVSKLTGNVDPQRIIDLAPGELQNLPGWVASNEGENSTLGEYPAYPARWHLGLGGSDEDRRPEDGRDPRRRRPLCIAAQRRRPGEPGRHRGCGNERHRRADDHHAVMQDCSATRSTFCRPRHALCLQDVDFVLLADDHLMQERGQALSGASRTVSGFQAVRSARRRASRVRFVSTMRGSPSGLLRTRCRSFRLRDTHATSTGSCRAPVTADEAARMPSDAVRFVTVVHQR